MIPSFRSDKIPKKFLHKLNPRKLSIVIASVSAFLALILFGPIASVFAGNWKLNQKVDILEDFTIRFDKLGLTWLADILSLDHEFFVGTFSLRFYALAIILGLLLGYTLTLYLSSYHYIAGTIVDRLLIGLIIFGLIGARLFFVAFNWDFYSDSPSTIITDTLAGGLAIYGMLLFGIIYIWIYCQRFKFNFYEFLDFLAPGVLVGQILGRWGNFFNYESYGPTTSVFWKMFVPETANFYLEGLTTRYYHPTFLYEIIPNIILLVLILYYYLQLTEKRSGMVFALYAIGYGVIRFVTEFFRLDALRIDLPKFLQVDMGDIGTLEFIRVSQVASLVLIGFGIYIIVRRSKILFLKKSMQEMTIR